MQALHNKCPLGPCMHAVTNKWPAINTGKIKDKKSNLKPNKISCLPNGEQKQARDM